MNKSFKADIFYLVIKSINTLTKLNEYIFFGNDVIRFICVPLGGVVYKQYNSFIERYSNKSLLKRMRKPKEIAPSVTFLLSEELSFITGHNLMVDGLQSNE